MPKTKKQDTDNSVYDDSGEIGVPQVDEFVFDEKKHVYKLNGIRMYGITSVLGVIAKPMLIQWSANQTAEFIRANCPKTKVKNMDVYLVNNKMLDEAKIAHRKKKESAGDIGKIVHKLAEDFANDNLGLQLEEGSTFNTRSLPNSEHLKSELGTEATTKEIMVVTMFTHFLSWALKNKVKFISAERKLYSKTHWIAGTVDAIVEIDGKRYVMDIKTYSGIYDRTPFLQMAGYALMLEELGEKIDGTIIVRLGKDGTFDVHKNINLAQEKVGFLSALTLFKTLEGYKK